MKKNAQTFTKGELLALKMMARSLAEYCREDIMGAILYTGAFHALPDDNGKSVVALHDKLSMTKDEEKVTRMDRGRRIRKNERALRYGKILRAKANGDLLGKK